MINSEGEIYLRSDEHRDLERNKSRCIEKLIDHVTAALHIPVLLDAVAKLVQP
jgi:hypothetical protein